MIALLLAAATPEATALGRQLAEHGLLASRAPTVMAREIEDIVAEHPELTDDDKRAFRASAEATGKLCPPAT